MTYTIFSYKSGRFAASGFYTLRDIFAILSLVCWAFLTLLLGLIEK